MGGYLMGCGGSQASFRSTKVHPIGNLKRQKTPIDSAELEKGKADAQGLG